MKEKDFRPILEVIRIMKENNISFYDYFSYVAAEKVEKEKLYNCTISYKFNNYHSENCYFEILAFSHETKEEINLGCIYTKDCILHPILKTTFFYSDAAAAMLYKFMLYFDVLLNDIYFSK